MSALNLDLNELTANEGYILGELGGLNMSEMFNSEDAKLTISLEAYKAIGFIERLRNEDRVTAFRSMLRRDVDAAFDEFDAFDMTLMPDEDPKGPMPDASSASSS